LNRFRLLTVLLIVAAGLTIGCVGVSAAAAAPAATASPPAMNMQGMASSPAPAASAQDQTSLANAPDSAPASPVSGTDWSIFNHRGAGLFILLWGLTAFLAGLQWPRRTWLRFAPPFALFGLVEFLIIRNDPKVWPIGPIGFWVSFQDPAVFQHRVFVLLILGIAIIELLRAADRLPPLARVYALPALAVFGAIFLFFHQHGGPAAQHMMSQMSDKTMATDPSMRAMAATMHQIKFEHVWFSVCGFGLAAAKLLADAGILKGRLGATLWSVFAIALGAYMLSYTE
jgi:hypothetical protein